MTTFQEARHFLLKHRTDYDAAGEGLPLARSGAVQLGAGLVRCGTGPQCRQPRPRRALDRRCRATGETKLSFAALSRRSNQVANFLRAQGLKRGDHLLLLLGNVVPLWETMLAAMKLGVVVIPATTLLTPDELRDRLDRGRARVVVASGSGCEVCRPRRQQCHCVHRGHGCSRTRLAAYRGGGTAIRGLCAGWPDQADDPMLLYFTSGTTAKPKLVRHSQRSYPVGALSTMYWLGLQPGDVHLNISSPGWAKHAWSCFFAPWNAGATVFVVNQPRFDAKGLAGDRRPLRRHHAVRAADGVAAVHPGEARRLQGVACARSAAPASRSTPK